MDKDDSGIPSNTDRNAPVANLAIQALPAPSTPQGSPSPSKAPPISAEHPEIKKSLPFQVLGLMLIAFLGGIAVRQYMFDKTDEIIGKKDREIAALTKQLSEANQAPQGTQAEATSMASSVATERLAEATRTISSLRAEISTARTEIERINSALEKSEGAQEAMLTEQQVATKVNDAVAAATSPLNAEIKRIKSIMESPRPSREIVLDVISGIVKIRIKPGAPPPDSRIKYTGGESNEVPVDLSCRVIVLTNPGVILTIEYPMELSKLILIHDNSASITRVPYELK